MTSLAHQIKQLARGHGFDLAGISPAGPAPDFARFEDWREAGYAGDMGYLTDVRGDLRSDPVHLLPSVQSVLSVGKIYHVGAGSSPEPANGGEGFVSKYACGEDYHDVIRRQLNEVVEGIKAVCWHPFEWRICVDTAPLLERSFGKTAGLGWVGKNTCLINQEKGSWFFLAELLLSIPLEPDAPAPDRCGTCTRCIDACPTSALVPSGDGWTLDARRCISYLTIEKRGTIDVNQRHSTGQHLFGCDICQEVCPWNLRMGKVPNQVSEAGGGWMPLKELAQMTDEDFRLRFRRTPVWRAKYSGFLRNVALAMGNSQLPEMETPLLELSKSEDPVIAWAANAGLERLRSSLCCYAG